MRMKPREMKSLMTKACHATMAAMSDTSRASARGLAVLAALGLASGLIVAWLTVDSDHLDEPVVDAVLALLVGWSFIGTGLFAWWRRPGNRTGLLMAAIEDEWRSLVGARRWATTRAVMLELAVGWDAED